MTEREKLEREVRRLRAIIRTNELALTAAMNAGDRAWITKQLGLRQIRLGKLREHLRWASAAAISPTTPVWSHQALTGSTTKHGPKENPGETSGEISVEDLGEILVARRSAQTTPSQAAVVPTSRLQLSKHHAPRKATRVGWKERRKGSIGSSLVRLAGSQQRLCPDPTDGAAASVIWRAI